MRKYILTGTLLSRGCHRPDAPGEAQVLLIGPLAGRSGHDCGRRRQETKESWLPMAIWNYSPLFPRRQVVVFTRERNAFPIFTASILMEPGRSD